MFKMDMFGCSQDMDRLKQILQGLGSFDMT